MASATDVLTAVRLGRRIALAPLAEFAGGASYPGTVMRHVDGIAPAALSMVWAQDSTSLDVARFVAHVEAAFAVPASAQADGGDAVRP